MPKEIQGVLDGIGGFFDTPAVQFGLRAIALYFVVLWLAGAYWAFRDMQLRTENPILPYGAASLIIVFTPIFFPFAIIVYRIIRPQERIGEVYERALAEEALLAEVEAIRTCPTCSRRVHEEWIICPTCRTRLNRVCPNCEKLVGLDWSLCAWCGRDFDRPDVVTALEPRPARVSWGPGEPTVDALPEPKEAAYGAAVAAAGSETRTSFDSVPRRSTGAGATGVNGTGVTDRSDTTPRSPGPSLRGNQAPLGNAAARSGRSAGIVNPRSGARRSAPGPLSEP